VVDAYILSEVLLSLPPAVWAQCDSWRGGSWSSDADLLSTLQVNIKLSHQELYFRVHCFSSLSCSCLLLLACLPRNLPLKCCSI
jgi:hypothetical protein